MVANFLYDRGISHNGAEVHPGMDGRSTVFVEMCIRDRFEERIRSIINELQKNPNVILFIDEIHTIVAVSYTHLIVSK